MRPTPRPLPIIYLMRIRISMPRSTVTVVPAPNTLPRWRQVIRSLVRGLAWEREWMGAIK